MPQINSSTPHKLTKDEAIARCKNGITIAISKVSEMGEKVENIRTNWVGDQLDFSFEVRNISVRGSAQVDDDSVDIAAVIPFRALPFKGKIQEVLTEKLSELLA